MKFTKLSSIAVLGLTCLASRTLQAFSLSDIFSSYGKKSWMHDAFMTGWEHPGKWVAAWILTLGIGSLLFSFFAGRKTRREEKENRRKSFESLKRMREYQPQYDDSERLEILNDRRRKAPKGFFDY